MATGSRTLKLSILAETKQLSDSLKSSSKDVETFGDKVTDFGKKAALAFAAAGAAAGAFAYKSIQNAAADEAAQRKLTETLQKTTAATDAQIAAVGAFIDKTSIAIGVTDDELRPAFSRLARSTNDVQKAQDLLNLALDISSATGKPLEAVANALGKAYDGNAAALGKLGLGIDQSILKSKDFDKIFQNLTGTFGGFAANEAQTTEKSFVRIKIAIDEAQERIGAALLPVTEKLTTFILNVAVPALNAFVGGLTGDQGLSDAFTDSEKKAFEWGERVRGLFKTVIAFKDELIALGAVIGSIFVVSKISAAVAGTIALIKSLIIAYNALKASALVAGIASAFALNPLLGVGAVALAAGVMAAAVKLAGTSDIDVDALGVATGSSNFTYNQGNPMAMGSTASSATGEMPTIIASTPTMKKIEPIGNLINPQQIFTNEQISADLKIPATVSQSANIMQSFSNRLQAQGDAFLAAQALNPPITVNIGVAGDPEATARVVVDTLNNSFYRGTRGAGLLAGIQ